MPFIKVKDGTRLHYKDWGHGKNIVFVHGWCLPSDCWEYIMTELAPKGFRCIAYDHRGCGRSEQPWDGYDIDTLASDLDDVINTLGLTDVALAGHSMGCAIICHYLFTKPATDITKAILTATTTPYVVKDETNPDGFAVELFDEAMAAMRNDKPAYVKSLAEPFFNSNDEQYKTSQEMINWAVRITENATLKAAMGLQQTNFFIDARKQLGQINTPVLLLHGELDVSAPVDLTARKTHALLPNSELRVYQGHAHGLPLTNWKEASDDIAKFVGQ